MPTPPLNRRTFLMGALGTAVGLPLLEAMLPFGRTAFAQTTAPPKRFLVCFDGQSIGGDNDPIHNFYVPDTVGANYDLKTALAPLAMYGNVKNEISVVSGLQIPVATGDGAAIPPSGRHVEFHIGSLNPLFTGMRSGPDTMVDGEWQHDNRAKGPSSDQVVASAIADPMRFRTLNYRVQASWYLTVSAPYGRENMSFQRDAGGTIRAVAAQDSPLAAYNSLFAGFVPTDPMVAARQDLLLRQRRSVLDLVRGNAERLTARLSGADRQRLEAHLEEIRALERRVLAIAPMTTATCRQPANPGADPAVGGNNVGTGGDSTFDVNNGYSDEESRARVFCDLIAMAFTCDLTRAGTLMFTMAQSHMNMSPLTGIPYDLHEVGHSSPGGMRTHNVSVCIAWHTKHFGYLVGKLRDTPEGDSNVLANSALVMLHEGGHGLDPSTGRTESSHSTERMACLIAGRAGGLAPGRHVVATGRHPGHVLNSAMRAVGVDQNLGEVTGVIPELFSA